MDTNPGQLRMTSNNNLSSIKPNWPVLATIFLLIVISIALSMGWIFADAKDESQLWSVPVGLFGIFASVTIFLLRQYCWIKVPPVEQKSS